ncbi:MAG: peptidoglycan-binding protein, partial [Vampirovibrionia bacterium]
ENTIRMTVKNKGVLNSTPTSNPAGVLYKLHIEGSSCSDIPEEPFVRSAEITSPSEGENVSGTVSFTATLTDEDNDDSVQWAVRKGSCDAGVNTVFGNVDGYSDSFSWDNTNFEATTDVSSWEDGLYCFVFNPSESSGDTSIRETREFNVVNDDNDDEGQVTNENIVVKSADLANNITDVVSDITKWFFYNDETGSIDGVEGINNNLGIFVNGPDTAPLGDGSAQISVPNEGSLPHNVRRNIATYQFSDVKLSDITELSFSTYSQLAGDGANGLSERAPYLNFNVDFDNSDNWQNRLIFVPGQNGVVTSDTWQTWDTINDGNALWTWSKFVNNGNKWPDNNTNQYRTWNDIISSFPNIQTRSTDSWFGFRVGEPYADGFTGNVDNFVIGIKNGLDTTIKTFDFEPTAEKTIEKVSRSRSSGSYIGASLLGGQVLGAETTCGIYVDKFLKKGLKGNDKDAVMKVQQFLNDYMKSGLKVDGIFGTQTEIALKAFQIKHADKILTPWGLKGPTGIFYLTTQTEVNNIMCPELNLPIPTLTPMALNPLFPRV